MSIRICSVSMPSLHNSALRPVTALSNALTRGTLLLVFFADSRLSFDVSLEALGGGWVAVVGRMCIKKYCTVEICMLECRRRAFMSSHIFLVSYMYLYFVRA